MVINDIPKIRNELVKWIKEWFDRNGPDCKAVIGISGGKDSSVVAALCVEALGKDRVLGVLMPNGTQSDIDDSFDLCDFLDIRYVVVNIASAYHDVLSGLENSGIDVSKQTSINLAPRLRMSTLYAISQSVNGRVVNTTNASEHYIGWGTRWGDTVGDLCPLLELTATEVMAIGKELGLPEQLSSKNPGDGLTGKSDEENFGFTYDQLDRVIRHTDNNEIADIPENIVAQIEKKHNDTRFKRGFPEMFDTYDLWDTLPF